ncbi:hypothetical protein [Streptomyces sp. NPDC051211]
MHGAGVCGRTDKVAGCDIKELEAYGSSLYWKCDFAYGYGGFKAIP